MRWICAILLIQGKWVLNQNLYFYFQMNAKEPSKWLRINERYLDDELVWFSPVFWTTNSQKRETKMAFQQQFAQILKQIFRRKSYPSIFCAACFLLIFVIRDVQKFKEESTFKSQIHSSSVSQVKFIQDDGKRWETISDSNSVLHIMSNRVK